MTEPRVVDEAPSLGMKALLLIRLDAHAGEMVPVDTLASMYRLQPQAVRAGLLALHAEGYVRCRLGADGVIDAAQAAAGY